MTIEQFEKLESILKDSTPMEEKVSYQKEIEGNPQLKVASEIFLEAKEVIALANIRKEVSAVHQKFIQNETSFKQVQEPKAMIKTLHWGKISKIAASILVFAGLWVFYEVKSITPESIIAEGIIEYNSSTFRGEKSDLNQIRNLYRNENYAKIIEVVKNETSPNAEMRFLNAMANFKLKNYQTALNEFDLLKKANQKAIEPSFVPEIAYFEALSLVGIKNYEQALQKLEVIKTDPNNPYKAGITKLQILKLKLAK